MANYKESLGSNKNELAVHWNWNQLYTCTNVYNINMSPNIFNKQVRTIFHCSNNNSNKICSSQLFKLQINCDVLHDLVLFVQFKNVKNTRGGVLILVKSNTPWVFFTFFKLYFSQFIWRRKSIIVRGLVKNTRNSMKLHHKKSHRVRSGNCGDHLVSHYNVTRRLSQSTFPFLPEA